MPPGPPPIRQFDWGVEVDVQVIPRARKTEPDGVRGDALLLRIAAPPVEGAANAALIEFFSTLLRVPRRAIRIVSGERSRRKRIAIDGVGAEAVRQALRLRSGQAPAE